MKWSLAMPASTPYCRGLTAISLLAMLSSAFVALGAAEAARPAPVSVQERDPAYRSGWKEGHRDHKWEERSVVLDSGKVAYTIKYSSCVDPSHPGVRVNEEGYIGMPTPSAANWYHSGFFFVRINGQEVGEAPLLDMRATERGERGACHLVWETADARVRVQFLVSSGSERLLCQVDCLPRDGKKVDSIEVMCRCYPSFFTSYQKRQGDRTLITPRSTTHEPAAVPLDPAADTYLLYQDGVFDVAKGEGDGPCAMLFLPEEIAGGTVQLTEYPVTTTLQAAPGVRRLRFAFWDFTGRTNAAAAEFLTKNGAAVRDELRALEFRPPLLAAFDVVATPAELTALLTAAGEDGERLRPAAAALVGKLLDLKTRADAGDWTAEAEFAKQYADYEAMRWNLRIRPAQHARRARADQAVKGTVSYEHTF
jgi:hypothetical protein